MYISICWGGEVSREKSGSLNISGSSLGNRTGEARGNIFIPYLKKKMVKNKHFLCNLKCFM